MFSHNLAKRSGVQQVGLRNGLHSGAHATHQVTNQMWWSIWSSSTSTFEYLQDQILVLWSAYCPMVIMVFLSPSGKWEIETQNSLTPPPSILYPIKYSLSPWHLTGRLNQSYQSRYSSTFFNQVGSISPTNMQPFIFCMEYAHRHVSIYVVREELAQMECVKFIVLGMLHTEYKQLRECI